ncbi:heavy metal-binding domain-containing protein [Legionella sp. CNM-1927-20]|uniref:heavy metal-binding domain-containing protein n=1 Tax=Legionella sp. CNM-1927-20 TaxID=3422221 RepID=UPI00403AEF45
MTVTTGLSGNELFCLAQKGFLPGNIVVGNSVHSLGIIGSVGSNLKAMLGGELNQVTRLIEEGRETALKRMFKEAEAHNASGITGVTSQLIFHGSNLEFLSIGSVIKSNNTGLRLFSTSADGQELYAQLDAGYQPICFALGNVAYSMGIGRGFIGGIKTLMRGEIKEYSNIFNTTRHLALKRIKAHAMANRANAVLGIQTTILPFGGFNEMLMIGTASKAPFLVGKDVDDVITSDMTNIEMWNMASLGYMPLQLLLGTSVYSLGIVGGITSAIKSFARGELTELSRLIYDARENSLGIINDAAKAMGADDVVGVKTYVYQLGNGLVEFLAIGTAVKKATSVKPQSLQLPPQAIVVDKDTYYNLVSDYGFNVNINEGSKPINKNASSSVRAMILIVFLFIFVIYHIVQAFF